MHQTRIIAAGHGSDRNVKSVKRTPPVRLQQAGQTSLTSLISFRAGFPDVRPEDSPAALPEDFPDGLPGDFPAALPEDSQAACLEDSPAALLEDFQDAYPAGFRVSFARTLGRRSTQRAPQVPQRYMPSSTSFCLQYARLRPCGTNANLPHRQFEYRNAARQR